ncbi:MAG: histidine ammonia-lyase [Melioribacteraceae bacterium]|nr:histidine ammonia-lyase [Melioribacteraceae bacterium]MCF8355009.1 histidine ammonia-lyase [Melioribacteraceae bacterium]MCF8394334.1 histidine ammonia-lyase [Melioribacteraceae bacterium]MCF8420013.1 histidine ammonia-lyase [Melioribacteraceae bacterium]
MKLKIDGKSLTLDKIDKFINNSPSVSLSAEAEKRVNKARKLIDEWVESGKIIYGVTTGFGEFANVHISKQDIEKLQENLIVSHSAGVGENLPPKVVKVMMLLRANALARGHSGIRLSTLQLLIDMINKNIIPVIPSQGSVGSSGDLAPLAHLVLAMLGKGKVQLIKNIEDNNTRIVSAGSALKKFGLQPVRLAAKEGLALINGTQMMTAYAALICSRAKRLIKLADISGALTHEALRATDKAYDHRLHDLRPFKGQSDTAKNLLKLIEGSEIRESHKVGDSRVQDSYSLRCMPQIHGASRDAVDYVCSRVEIELNSVNDNPLIFPDDGDHLEGGNFHGQPIALAMDFMSIALSEIANVAERRIERLTNGSLSDLPRFLARDGGLNSGLMIAQYTAAALVSENKVLSHPASVDSIPTSANQEDHNSMGSISARKCYQILKNVETVIAIELLTASQGIEFLKPLKCGKGTRQAYVEIRKQVKPLWKDRVIHDDLQKVLCMVVDGSILNAVEKSVKLA